MDRVLVVRGGALGDFVLGLPALRTLREAFPHAHLELMAPSAMLPLASPLVDVATPLERAEVAALFGDAGRFSREMVSRYARLDLVVLWLADADGSVRRNFQRLDVRQVLWSPALPPPGRHATDHLLATLEPLGIAPASGAGHGGAPNPRAEGVPAPAAGGIDRRPRQARAPSPILRPSEAARARASALWRGLGLDSGRVVVALHPGSGGDWKRWPVERFGRVADCLAEAGLGVVVIQGPADDEVIRQLLLQATAARLRVVSDLAVEELAAFLSLPACYLGNDSGVTHLAAAVGTPTVAIFGPTDPAQWGPRGARVVVLRAEEGCNRCGRERGAGCQERICLEGIGVERVVESVRALLE